jgi:hypothetical protein
MVLPLLLGACGATGEPRTETPGSVALSSGGLGLRADDARRALKAACADATPNLLANGGFELGLEGWTSGSWVPGAGFARDDVAPHAGAASARIAADAPNDASLFQRVAVEPGTLYRLSGWIRTQDVELGAPPGANLAFGDTWSHSPGLDGTRPWTFQSVVHNTGDQTEVAPAARLGYWAATTTGSAWFDQLRLAPVRPRQHPRWRFLVLVYAATDFTIPDAGGAGRRVVARMTAQEARTVAAQSRRFVEEDLPRLSSGAVAGEVTIRFPGHPLRALSPAYGGWWPSPGDTAADRDPLFDAAIVIWDPRGHDAATGEEVWLGSAGGLTQSVGTAQTYSAIVVDMFVVWNAGANVLKHEVGHALLWFHDELGVTPKPVVTNHAGPGDYVHCPTGEPYVWEDETPENPIPNSIYNDDSGFAHDYYSGTTALPADPTRCLGIGPGAWAYGGPATVNGLAWALDPGQRVLRLAQEVLRLVVSGDLPARRGVVLLQELRLAWLALDAGRTAEAIRALQSFAGSARHLVEADLLPTSGGALGEDALDVVDQLCG